VNWWPYESVLVKLSTGIGFFLQAGYEYKNGKEDCDVPITVALDTTPNPTCLPVLEDQHPDGENGKPNPESCL